MENNLPFNKGIPCMSSMRRKDKEITEKTVMEEILRENEVGRLGTAVNGRPYVVPMNFAYRDGKIYLHSHKDGKKFRDIAENNLVCFEVDSGEMIEGSKPCDYSWNYGSVIAYGKAMIINDAKEKLEALKIISDRYAWGKGSKLTLKMVENMQSLAVIRIDINEMTGKKSPV
jgi:nitroimidazol reductase NimA-like FMN-containing flavoprotein (pyridoxamine 5'-phosphate oxidase superfamily)